MIADSGTLPEFTARLLALRGATVAPIGKDLLEARLGPELKQRLRRESVILAFSEDAASKREEAELVTPGSHFFSALLSLARQTGMVVRMVARERSKSTGGFLKQMKFEDFGVEITDRERYYHTFLRFHFLLSYCSVDSTHEMRTVLYDVALRRVSSEADGSWDRVILESASVRKECLPSVSHDELRSALGAAGSYAIARVKHKVLAFRARSASLLENELDRLESYYRRLIHEEGSSGAESTYGKGGESKRAERSKLEWERKASTEALRFRPRIRLSLVGLEELCVPRSLLTLRVDAHPFTEFYGVFDQASARARGAFCQGCNNLALTVKLHSAGAILCENCFSQADK